MTHTSPIVSKTGVYKVYLSDNHNDEKLLTTPLDVDIVHSQNLLMQWTMAQLVHAQGFSKEISIPCIRVA